MHVLGHFVGKVLKKRVELRKSIKFKKPFGRATFLTALFRIFNELNLSRSMFGNEKRREHLSQFMSSSAAFSHLDDFALITRTVPKLRQSFRVDASF